MNNFKYQKIVKVTCKKSFLLKNEHSILPRTKNSGYCQVVRVPLQIQQQAVENCLWRIGTHCKTLHLGVRPVDLSSQTSGCAVFVAEEAAEGREATPFMEPLKKCRYL